VTSELRLEPGVHGDDALVAESALLLLLCDTRKRKELGRRGCTPPSKEGIGPGSKQRTERKRNQHELLYAGLQDRAYRARPTRGAPRQAGPHRRSPVSKQERTN